MDEPLGPAWFLSSYGNRYHALTMDLADTMRAVVTRGHGGLEQLDLTDVPVPRPAPGWVVVDVSACGLNNTDIWTREGRYGTDRDPDAVTSTSRKPGRFPIIQGADVVGHIAAVGDGVASARIGERVLCNFVLYEGDPQGRDISGSLGATHDGGYAEYVALPADNAYPVDDLALADEELATFPCACITAEHMLDAVGLAAGESVLVTGASGGAGSALVQLARVRGAEVVALTSRQWADRVQELQPRGVVLRDAGDVVEQAQGALGRDTFDVVADVVGGPHFSDCLALLGPGGRYVSAGAMGGAVVPFDIRTLYLKKLTLIGVSIGHRHHFEAVLDHIRGGRLRPLLAKSFPMSEIRAAQEMFMSKAFFGNIVVRPEE